MPAPVGSYRLNAPSNGTLQYPALFHTTHLHAHKDQHVASIVDDQDRVLDTRSFATTQQGYRQMLAWMRSFGDLQRIGVESTGSYGAGIMRFMQQAGVMVLEVTAPDKQYRRRGKNDVPSDTTGA